MIAFLLLSIAALAQGHVVVGSGDTVESVAAGLGSPDLAEQIRALNGLAAGAQPQVGAVLGLPAAPDHLHSDGLLLALSGTGRLYGPGLPEVTLAEAMALPEGAMVCTDAGSYATVRLAMSSGGTHDDISLLAETCVTIESAAFGAGRRSSLVSLERGSVSVRVAEDAGTVSIATRAGVTTGDGGGYRVTMEDDAARTEAVATHVAVMGAGVEVAVGAGQGSRTFVGKAPSPPVDLLPAGLPLEPGNGARLRRPDFTWTPVERALGYRIQVSVQPDFSKLVLVEEVSVATWRPSLLFLPYRVPGLWWRVASFDRTGFLGPWSDVRSVTFPAGVGP